MLAMPPMALPARLDHLFPGISPQALSGPGTSAGHCWIALAKSQGEEHHPPFYWLGRALDAVDASEDATRFMARLAVAHGPERCDSDLDERIQDVCSEACAFAWAGTHLGPPRFEAAVEGATLEAGRLRIRIEAHDAYVLPARLRPPLGTLPAPRGMRSPDEAIARAAAEHVREAAMLLPPARGRIAYVDTWIVEMYAQNVGYRLELTEPVEAAMRDAAGSLHVGSVLTRPFQWGNPVVAWY
jgi:hypothetical protein